MLSRLYTEAHTEPPMHTERLCILSAYAYGAPMRTEPPIYGAAYYVPEPLIWSPLRPEAAYVLSSLMY